MMDRRRPLSELESKELITRLNNANSSLNEKLTELRKLVKFKEEAMDKMWKRHETIQANLFVARGESFIIEDTNKILQETIDSLAGQLAKHMDTLHTLEVRLERLEDDMDYFPDNFEFFDAHQEIQQLTQLVRKHNNPPKKENK